MGSDGLYPKNKEKQMNKRVRVCREMPFAKVGEEIDIEWYTLKGNIYANCCIGGMELSSHQFDDIMKNGWIEEIEEPKSLEEKLSSYLDGKNKLITTKEWRNHLSRNFNEIAHNHYKELFDRFDKEWLHTTESNHYKDYVCKALFGGEDE